MTSDPRRKSDVDEALQETFPASDPPAYSGSQNGKEKDKVRSKPDEAPARPAKPGAEGGIVGEGSRQTTGASDAKK